MRTYQRNTETENKVRRRAPKRPRGLGCFQCCGSHESRALFTSWVLLNNFEVPVGADEGSNTMDPFCAVELDAVLLLPFVMLVAATIL